MFYNVISIRQDFPGLHQKVNNHPLVYLDSAASTQKPLQVFKKESEFTLYQYAAVHRGIHTLSIQATSMMEKVRQKAANFIHASSAEEIVFVKGTTEAINLVANSFGRKFIGKNDNIIITEMEHHANIVPWYMLSKVIGFEIRILSISDTGKLKLEKLNKLIDAQTRLLSFTHISNVLGTINPVKEIIQQAKTLAASYGTELHVLIDGAQGAMHSIVNMQDLDCDFYAFSGHKLYGPTGIGILYAKKTILDQMPPWEGGGSMIQNVSFKNGITYADAPWRFEAGTPNITAIIGLGAAFDYLSEIGQEKAFSHEEKIMTYATQKLKDIPALVLFGNDKRKGVISFNLGTHHSYDVGLFLDQYGIAIRTGHHCALPLMNRLNISAACRASIGIYTTQDDIDVLFNALKRINTLLG
ncbi:Cysteine desulfurase [Candidatus Hartigia pinicola]|nr:Cysteine desulfurase [Candidatus Hartigia pinicola]